MGIALDAYEAAAADRAALAGLPPLSVVDAALEQAWDAHAASRDEDEPLEDERPGGSTWQAIYDEATVAAQGRPTDLWNRISEDERSRYCTLAAVGRRQRGIRSSEPPVASGRKQSFLSAREFMATAPPAVEWYWNPYVARGTVVELVGRAKAAGKTTLLALMTRSLLDGRPFLGRKTSATSVVLLTEQPPATLRAVLARAGLDDREDLRIRLWRDSRLMRWPDQVAEAVAECHRIGAGLLIVDTLPQFAGIRGDAENDAGAALAALEPLQAAAANGLAVLVVRHERKGGGEVGDSGRGSTAFTGAVDVVLQLSRPPNAARTTIRKLAALSRFDETPEDLMIELTDDGYIALGEEGAVAFHEATAATLAAVPDDDVGLAMAELYALVDGKPTTIQAAVGVLRDQGLVERIGAGRKGDPYRYRRPQPMLPHASGGLLEETATDPGIHSSALTGAGGGRMNVRPRVADRMAADIKGADADLEALL